ncbi:glycosyltransferase family 4 protein [Flavobacterium muglaense]|uniref:Glycosyltransferase family 4 protein n=1 Tax=Flavobacterium muglaense TaxID=2764716 RepID=A0A923MX24_9FLAO|nr:glycosyltransferase family 1 protein [Flavobacterium muglaense]MBC5836628.1 glycosyltransferase family 4 protein [Flavobacterium muglaense]MBC5843106.1 glycosyltransferase family 4 protein [Flavobacterium muglaense]
MNIGFEAKRVFHNTTGLGNYSRDLVRLLSQYYPENKYYLYNPKTAKQNLFLPNNSNVFEKKPTTPFYTKFYNLWRQKGVVKDLVNDQITIFHGLSGEIPRGLAAHNIKSIVTIHDLIFVKYPHLYSFFDRKIHFYKFKKAAQEADLVIAISEQTKNDIVEFLKIDPSKIKVIYQGCHAAFKTTFSKEKKADVIKKYDLPEEFILNVGTIETRKNVLLAVKAIKDIDSCLVIVGKETAYTTEVKNYIRANNIQHKVKFLQGLDINELAMLYQLATIFVYPSLYEGFGIPIIEALYCKTPVITTNNGVFPEAGGPHTLYVAPTNVEQMKEAMERLLNDQNLRNEITSRSYEFVQKFNDKNIALAVNKLYTNIG